MLPGAVCMTVVLTNVLSGVCNMRLMLPIKILSFDIYNAITAMSAYLLM